MTLGDVDEDQAAAAAASSARRPLAAEDGPIDAADDVGSPRIEEHPE